MDYRHETATKYSAMRDGESLTGELCPKCDGGRSKERTFSIRRNAGYLSWICWRASCHFRGRNQVGTASELINNREPYIPPKKQSPPCVVKDIPHEARRLLEDRYGITEEHVNLGRLQWTNDWSREDEAGRLYAPVFSWLGVRVGFQARSLTGSKPKALSFTQDSDMAWYHNDRSDTVVIVEDQLSAIRLGKYVTSVALLGTYINPSRIHELLSSKAFRYCLWLDKDAFEQSVLYAIKYKHLVKLEVTKLNKDVKDLNEQELIQLLTHEGILT